MGKPNKTMRWFQVVKKVFRSPSKEKFDNKDSNMLKISSPMHYYVDFCTNLNVTKLTKLEQHIKR
jgi:hypothetical protein